MALKLAQDNLARSRCISVRINTIFSVIKVFFDCFLEQDNEKVALEIWIQLLPVIQRYETCIESALVLLEKQLDHGEFVELAPKIYRQEFEIVMRELNQFSVELSVLISKVCHL